MERPVPRSPEEFGTPMYRDLWRMKRGERWIGYDEYEREYRPNPMLQAMARASIAMGEQWAEQYDDELRRSE